mgnify:FL=1|tara:strand:+ start:1655 stop:2620 length:966 start_codon:yes stop_codon:yes gene_type:complete
MLWSSKHIYFDKTIEQQLLRLVGMNVLIYGPLGNSKNMYADQLVKHLTGIHTFDEWEWSTIELNDEKKSEISLFTRESKFHVDILLNEMVCNNKSIVKYYIKSFLKNRCISIDGNLLHKTIVVYNAEYLSNQSQHELKTIIEKYSLHNTFILISERVDFIIENVKNMLIMYRIGLPTSTQMLRFVKNTLIEENVSVSTRTINQYIDFNQHNPVDILNSLQLYVYKIPNTNDKLIQKLCDSIKNAKFKHIREILYILLVQNICPITIIKHIVNTLGTYEIIMYAARYSHSIKHSERVIYHLEAFTNCCVMCLQNSVHSKNKK